MLIAATAISATMARSVTVESGDPELHALSLTEFSREVDLARSNLVEIAGDEKFQSGLILAVDAVVGRRLMRHPVGDEQQPAFAVGLAETRDAFVAGVRRLDPERTKEQGLSEFLQESYGAYTNNYPAFSRFAIRKTSGDLQQVDILRIMLRFSLTVYLTDRGRWLAAASRSHFWPLCKAMR